MGGGNVQTALIDLGSSLSVTTPNIAKLSGATLVGGLNLHPLNVMHDIFCYIFLETVHDLLGCSKQLLLLCKVM